MAKIVFYLIIFMELYCLALIIVPSKERKEIINSMYPKTTKTLPYMKEIFILMLIFFTIFIIFLNIFKIYSVYKVFGATMPINQLKKYLILYFGMNTFIILLFLFSKFSKTIIWLSKNPIYLNIFISLLTTLFVTLSNLWYSSKTTIFHCIILMIQLVYLVKELKLIKNKIPDWEYLFILTLYIGMIFYCSYTIFSKIVMLFV